MQRSRRPATLSWSSPIPWIRQPTLTISEARWISSWGIYKDAANNVSNKEVSAAYKDVLADLDKINEAMGAETFDYYSDEMLALTQDLTEHGDKLNELCGFSWDR